MPILENFPDGSALEFRFEDPFGGDGRSNSRQDGSANPFRRADAQPRSQGDVLRLCPSGEGDVLAAFSLRQNNGRVRH